MNKFNFKSTIHIVFMLFILLSLLSFMSCLRLLDTVSGVTIERIKERGSLIAITTYGENSYFIYRGEPFGFEYELLTLLADELEVDLEIHLAESGTPLIDTLNNREGDLIAANIAITKTRAETYDFTNQILTTQQVLVQRNYATGIEPVRNVTELIGREITVIANSHYYDRLINLQEEIGGTIRIKTVDHEESEEDLIRKVSNGLIPFTVSDETVAMIHKLYYPNIDIQTPVSFPQRVAWIVRRESPELRDFINNWIERSKKDGTLDRLYEKYYLLDRILEEKITFSLDPEKKNVISPYDELIRKYAPLINWDWRLIASIIYQESRFNPRARSWAGAVGLMQIMPQTARALEMSDRLNPEESIHGGIRHLKGLIELWTAEVGSGPELTHFVLASYNAGSGHVEDARKLALKNGKDPNIWFDNVDFYMLKLSNPQFYNDPIVEYGYCRGSEPYNYVKEIVTRYNTYKQNIPLIVDTPLKKEISELNTEI
jgi:membrane-bound lytic murein transglycosylase F